MSNEVNTRKFYQFLSSFEKGEQSWTNVADGEYGNADGTVIKSEFRKFLNAEWNGEQNGELNNDLINTFWKKIDTNTSASKIKGTKLRNLNALDKEEAGNLDKKLEAYVQLNEFVANNVKIPNVLTSTGSQWKWDVVDELTLLVEEFVKNGGNGDIKQVLAEAYPAIANKNTATYCAVEYQNVLKSTVLADYPDYKVADDNTLNSILTAFVATIDGNATPEDIKAEVLQIVDAYLATAGIGDDSGYDLSELGYKQDANSALNDIQKSVLTQTIKNNLSAIKKEDDYDNYPEIFDSAIQTFVDNKLAVATYGDFETLKSVGMAEFKATKEYQSIANRILVDKNFRNIEQGSDFYKALVEAFGENLAQTIMLDGRYLKNSEGENVYTAILDDVQEKIGNGEFTTDGKVDLKAVQNYIIEEISKNLNDFFPNGYGDASIQSLNTLYDKRAEAATKETDDNESLKQHREAAIDYCDAISKKGQPFKVAIAEVFGTDYEGQINSMYPSEIVSKMKELKAKALEIGDISDCKVSNWTGLPEDGSQILLGQTLTNTVGVSITDNNNKPVAANRITYSVQANGNCNATINDLGTLTITAGSVEGRANITVAVMVDGIEVGTKTISLECRRLTAEGMANSIGRNAWGGSYNHCEVYGMPNVRDHQTQMTSNSFADLYNNNAVILLDRGKDKDYKTTRVTDNLVAIMNMIKNAMSTVLTDKARLDSAVSSVLNELLETKTEDSSHDNTEDAELGTRVSDRIQAGQYSGVVHFADTDNRDYHVTMISFREIVDRIFAAYEG